MSAVYPAAAIFLVIVAAWLALLMQASYGASAVQPIPRCVVAVGGDRDGWAACR